MRQGEPAMKTENQKNKDMNEWQSQSKWAISLKKKVFQNEKQIKRTHVLLTNLAVTNDIDKSQVREEKGFNKVDF